MNIPVLPSNNRVTWTSLLLLTTTSHVHAQQTCFENGFGEIECSGLSNGARIGIAVAIVVAALLGLIGLTIWRRRRARNQNLIYLTYPNANGAYDARGQVYGLSQYPPQNPPPQYPPQVYTEQQPYNGYSAPYTGYDTGYQFKPPPGSPPPVKN